MSGKFLTLFIVLVASSCSTKLEAADGGSCRVRSGDQRDDVHARCGHPCAEGNLPEGYCGTGYSAFAVCSNHCDIYVDEAVCFGALGTEVVDVLAFKKVVGGPSAPCHW